MTATATGATPLLYVYNDSLLRFECAWTPP